MSATQAVCTGIGGQVNGTQTTQTTTISGSQLSYQVVALTAGGATMTMSGSSGASTIVVPTATETNNPAQSSSSATESSAASAATASNGAAMATAMRYGAGIVAGIGAAVLL
jgi:hypothetical protein